jgi:acylphosphatase
MPEVPLLNSTTVKKGPLAARRYTVSGRVQGVGFRNFVEHVAGKIGITGFVRNRRDGSVEVYAIGQPDQLQSLRVALEKGPMIAHVSGVSEAQDSVDNRYLGTFTIEMTIE